jgi:hypothetical protein
MTKAAIIKVGQAVEVVGKPKPKPKLKPKLTLAQSLAAFDPVCHGGEVMAASGGRLAIRKSVKRGKGRV